jgi:hypothetical protein
MIVIRIKPSAVFCKYTGYKRSEGRNELSKKRRSENRVKLARNRINRLVNFEDRSFLRTKTRSKRNAVSSKARRN